MTENRCSCIKPWERRRATYIELDGIEHDLCQPIAALINRSDSKLRMIEAERGQRLEELTIREQQLGEALLKNNKLQTLLKRQAESDSGKDADLRSRIQKLATQRDTYKTILREAQAFIIAIDYEIGPRFEQKRGEIVRKIEAMLDE